MNKDPLARGNPHTLVPVDLGQGELKLWSIPDRDEWFVDVEAQFVFQCGVSIV
jgi:hypothetical protein